MPKAKKIKRLETFAAQAQVWVRARWQRQKGSLGGTHLPAPSEKTQKN